MSPAIPLKVYSTYLEEVSMFESPKIFWNQYASHSLNRSQVLFSVILTSYTNSSVLYFCLKLGLNLALDCIGFWSVTISFSVNLTVFLLVTTNVSCDQSGTETSNQKKIRNLFTAN